MFGFSKKSLRARAGDATGAPPRPPQKMGGVIVRPLGKLSISMHSAFDAAKIHIFQRPRKIIFRHAARVPPHGRRLGLPPLWGWYPARCGQKNAKLAINPWFTAHIPPQGNANAVCSSIVLRLFFDCSSILNRRTIGHQSDINRRTGGAQAPLTTARRPQARPASPPPVLEIPPARQNYASALRIRTGGGALQSSCRPGHHGLCMERCCRPARHRARVLACAPQQDRARRGRCRLSLHGGHRRPPVPRRTP